MSFSVNYMCADSMPVHISTLVLAKILHTFQVPSSSTLHRFYIFVWLKYFSFSWNVFLIKVGETMKNVTHPSLSHLSFDFFCYKCEQIRSKHSPVLSIQCEKGCMINGHEEK